MIQKKDMTPYADDRDLNGQKGRFTWTHVLLAILAAMALGLLFSRYSSGQSLRLRVREGGALGFSMFR